MRAYAVHAHHAQGNPLYDLAVWQGVARDLRGDPGESLPSPHLTGLGRLFMGLR